MSPRELREKHPEYAKKYPLAKWIYVSGDIVEGAWQIAHQYAKDAMNLPNAAGGGPKTCVHPRNDFFGQIGEWSISQFFRVPHVPGPKKKAADVLGICVRCRSGHNEKLIIRPGDRGKLGSPWAHVTYQIGLPFSLIHGWGIGSALIRLGKWTDEGNGRPKAWFVDNRHLQPPDTLHPPVWAIDF